MKKKKRTKTTSADLSSISHNFEFHPDKLTNSLIILIELEFPKFFIEYIDVIENFVKSHGKQYKINHLHIVRDWKSANMWVFNTDIPFNLVG
ncbi:MAG: hypothetical protein WCJ03_05030 [Bacteroidales bacterium]